MEGSPSPAQRSSASSSSARAEALIAWLGGQKSVAAAKRAAGVRGDLDHFAALGFLQGLLTVLRDCGHPGLLLVLDEVETLQRVRGDVREKALNALRQLLDEIDAGRFPGLFLVITGTLAFYDGQHPRHPPDTAGSPVQVQPEHQLKPEETQLWLSRALDRLAPPTSGSCRHRGTPCPQGVHS